MPAGTIVSSGALVSPGGQQGLTGPTAAPSTDAGNTATLGSDSRIYVPPIPAGVIWEFGGATAPTGWLLCDGTSYPTATYPNLFAAIGYTFGGSGANFSVPDKRGKAGIGAGQGTGLTNRILGASGGEEAHVLASGEQAAHTHSIAAGQFNHSHPISAGQFSHNHNQNYTTGSGSGSAQVYVTATANVGLIGVAAATLPGGNTDAVTIPAGATATNSPAGAGHNNMMPFLVTNFIVKT